jgi:hypothetical protein
MGEKETGQEKQSVFFKKKFGIHLKFRFDWLLVSYLLTQSLSIRTLGDIH